MSHGETHAAGGAGQHRVRATEADGCVAPRSSRLSNVCLSVAVTAPALLGRWHHVGRPYRLVQCQHQRQEQRRDHTVHSRAGSRRRRGWDALAPVAELSSVLPLQVRVDPCGWRTMTLHFHHVARSDADAHRSAGHGQRNALCTATPTDPCDSSWARHMHAERLSASR